MNKYKTIGILGGMGPAATADLYSRIASIFQERYNAKYDKDFPEIVIISLPIPDIVEDIEDGNLTIKMLIDAVKRLESSGSSFIVIPCNTVHVYLNLLRKSVKIPIISIMEEVAEISKEQNILNVGLLSTEFTKDKKLYELELNNIGINIISLIYKKQEILTKLIMDILQVKTNQSNKDILLELIKNLKNKNAEGVILGCTELSLQVKQEDCDILLIDTTDILTEACVRESTKVI